MVNVGGSGVQGAYILSFNGRVFVLPINPASLEISHTARTQVLMALTRAFVEQFGPGLGTIQISGTMGWGADAGTYRTKTIPPGIQMLQEFIDLYKRFLTDAAASNAPDAVQMTFTDGATGRTWRVVPEHAGLRETQHRSSPMLRHYALSLIIMYEITSGRVQASSITLAKATDLFRGDVAHVAASYMGAALLATASERELVRRRLLYTVQAGDTLASIGQVFAIDPTLIARRNGVYAASAIQPGLVLDVSPADETQDMVR